MKARRFIAILLCLHGLGGCGPVPDPRAREVDLRAAAPSREYRPSARARSHRVRRGGGLEPDQIRISPPLAVTGVSGPATRVLISGETQEPGRRYLLEAEAHDARGNTASFMAEFYGYNGRVPRLLINEFIPRGSGNHPDLVELKALSAGNMGGVVLTSGTPSSFDGAAGLSLPSR